MTDWKENAHLFCNGKFSIEWPATGMRTEILGYEKYVSTDNKDCFILSDGDYLPPGRCTLIARPISDMTDEEIYSVMDYTPSHNIDYATREKEYRMQRISEDREYFIHQITGFVSMDACLKMLSFGVYPFDQSHFEDGTVIDATEIDQ